MKPKNISNLASVQPVGATFFVTCAINGAIPELELKEIRSKYMRQMAITSSGLSEEEGMTEKHNDRGNYIFDIDKVLDVNHGPCFLESPDIARILLARIESYNMKYYRLLALSIMPNHFHMLVDTSIQIRGILEPGVTPKDYVHLSEIIQLIKNGSARYIHRLRDNAEEAVWERESFELCIRNEKMLKNALIYIADNPVKAGLVKRSEEHPFTFVYE